MLTLVPPAVEPKAGLILVTAGGDVVLPPPPGLAVHWAKRVTAAVKG
jgi:hypothetical protein